MAPPKILVILAAYLSLASSFKPVTKLGRYHVSRPVLLSTPRVLQPNARLLSVQHAAAPLTSSSSGSSSLGAPGKHRDDLVTVYWTPGCEFCARAKGLLDQMGLVWEGVDVGTGPDAASAREALAKLTGQSSVPQIYMGELKIGGYDDLVQLRDSGDLEAVVEAKGLLKVDLAAAAAATNSVAGEAEAVDIKTLHDPSSGVLNMLKTGAVTDAGGSAVEVAADLQTKALALHDQFVNLDGTGVDYARLAQSATTAEFVEMAARLAALPASELSSCGLDFWINLYNALVMHASVVVGYPTDKESRAEFFSGASGAKYRVGSFDFSLDDIEHGILRGSPEGDARSFSEEDRRKFLAADKVDPRIHFALNCGAKSCPPVKVYSAEGLNSELKAAAASFVADNVSVPDETGTVIMSKLFEWYGKDFAANDVSLLRLLASYLPFTSRLRANLLAARGRLVHGYGLISLVYEDYEWARNDAISE